MRSQSDLNVHPVKSRPKNRRRADRASTRRAARALSVGVVRQRVRFVRLASLGLVAVSLAGLLTVHPQQPAEAADATDSAVTVSWAGSNAEGLQEYQPARDPESIHYGDFDELSVSVSQTADLTDQVVQVQVAGFDGPTIREQSPSMAEQNAHDATNYVQTMQCWGDPLAEDFYKNCLWGGWSSGYAPQSGKETFSGGANGGSDMRGTLLVDVPFRTAQGAEIASLPVGSKSPLQEWFTWANTNEEVKQRVDTNGTSVFDFELQSAAAAPQLGCGRESERCWLVVVPRGSHITAATSDDLKATEGCPIEGVLQGSKFQVGSPINPDCDYWGNRVVVPLDFRPVTQACAVGSAERRAVGSELVLRAFSSWQPALCETTGTAFSYATAADVTARSQLLSGQAGLAFVNQPLTSETLGDEVEATQLADTEIAYAPVAVSGLTIAYQANNYGAVPETVKLTPRLIAKMLTHSYTNQEIMPLYFWQYPEGQWTRKDGQITRTLADDPEFQELNGTDFVRPSGNIILTGPNGADAIELLWRYAQVDDQARAFLAGEADPWGMTINPYYLPKGHSGAKVPVVDETENDSTWSLVGATDGSGEYIYRDVGLSYSLVDTAPSTFLKAEETLGPQSLVKSSQQTRRFDITQAYPYAADYGSAARAVFIGDTNAKTLWDTSKFNSAGEVGDYVSQGRSLTDQIFSTGIVDSATAAGYGLSTAELQLPNRPEVFASADAAGLAAGLTAQAGTGVDGVEFTDPANLPDAAYPLTLVSYAAVRLTDSDADARNQYADLIEYAAEVGQVSGSGRGQLPAGYLPLTTELAAQAKQAAAMIRAWQSGGGAATGSDPAISGAGAPAASAPTASSEQPLPGAQTSVSSLAADEGTGTGAVVSPGSFALGGSLLLGAAGALGAPFLLRRRLA